MSCFHLQYINTTRKKIKSQYVLLFPENPLPAQINSQTDVYEYEKQQREIRR